ncbi:MAG: response regulator transcription factor, partial [Eudoraea sp.]|nr:response regulator transcription factor [Eudoraea sp.]
MKQNEHTVVIVDDHLLLSGSLEKLISSFDGFKVLYHASNGKELQQKLKINNLQPDIILLDINMPVMDGFETAEWLTEN